MQTSFLSPAAHNAMQGIVKTELEFLKKYVPDDGTCETWKEAMTDLAAIGNAHRQFVFNQMRHTPLPKVIPSFIHSFFSSL